MNITMERLKGKEIVTDEYRGYLLDDIAKAMPPIQHIRFQDWIQGQTLGVSKTGKSIVYTWDLERFLQGLPVLD